MKHLLTIGILVIALSLTTNAQINYSGKIETGYLKFNKHTVQIDPGPDWKGYDLHEDQNGIDLNLINGIALFKERAFVGIGLGYLNFEGVNGISVFSDFEYLPLKTRLTPLLNLKIGYDHIWNQYDGGKGSALTEFGVGINYRLTEKLSVFLKSGLLLTQQSSLIPIRIGIRF